MPPPRATAREARFASTRGTPPERARRRPPSPSAVWPGTVASERPHAAYLAKQAMDGLLPERFVRQGRAARPSPCRARSCDNRRLHIDPAGSRSSKLKRQGKSGRSSRLSTSEGRRNHHGFERQIEDLPVPLVRKRS